MRLKKYSYNNAEKAIPKHILYPIYWDLEKLQFISRKKGTIEIRSKIRTILDRNGWSKRIQVVPDSQITITSQYDYVGLCLQFGNMARFYADLLKLQLMFENNRIESAIYILPMKDFASKLGSNVANFERFTSELSIFQQIIIVPIMVIGIQGE